jgi:FAD/FMN-containing dehydrogenase
MKRRTFVRSTFAAAATTIPARKSFASLYRLVTQDVGDLVAVRGDGTKITLRGASIKALKASLKGQLLLAKDQGYDEARQILNPSFDKHPALIVQPTTTDDIRRAVEFAHGSSLLVAVKCGGHSFSGQSTCDGGLQIDLARYRGVQVDPKARKVSVMGGTLLGQVDREVLPHGLVTPLGTVSHTGVGGLTTGGGFGRVARRFGLALDNVTAVDVVTADGQLRHANKDENPDLYWAVRGGGGNFGIVSSFEFALHPLSQQVIGGNLIFPISKARDVFSFYGEYLSRAPDELYLDLVLEQPPGGGPGRVRLHTCYSGPSAQAAKVLEPIRKLGTPLSDEIKPIDYVALQRSTDMTDPRALGLYLKSGFIRRLGPDLIGKIIDGFKGDPGRLTTVMFQHCGGAISRIPVGATAFAHRYAALNMIMLVGWPAQSSSAAPIGWAREYWKSLEPFTQGFYTNEVETEHTVATVNANYRENYPRLVAIKQKYDPGNLFRLNANIQPRA